MPHETKPVGCALELPWPAPEEPPNGQACPPSRLLDDRKPDGRPQGPSGVANVLASPFVRLNIAEGKLRLPLRLRVAEVDLANGDVPFPDAAADVWHYDT